MFSGGYFMLWRGKKPFARHNLTYKYPLWILHTERLYSWGYRSHRGGCVSFLLSLTSLCRLHWLVRCVNASAPSLKCFAFMFSAGGGETLK